MKTIKFTLLALAIVAGGLSSCKKKKTEVPAPTVNVKSFTFSTTSSAWTLNNKDYSAILTVEEIDADILSSGVVNVFWGDGTGSTWTAMPVTVQNIQCSYSMSIHTAKVMMSSGNDNNPMANPGVQQFRVVVIKGSARAAHPTVDWKNYNEVKAVFHLKD